MNKNMLSAVLTLFILGAGFGAYFYWTHLSPAPGVDEEAAPAPVLAPEPPAQAQQLIGSARTDVALPNLQDSDRLMLDSLAALLGNKSLMQLFNSEHMIRNLVVTIDNLTRMQLPVRMMPLVRAPGKFVVGGKDDALSMSPDNALRYAAYVRLAEAMDAKKLVGIYVRLYPLFQEAYVELGYPKLYFNDRLIEVIDDLLDAPDIKGPVKLVRPNVLYQFADPDLDALPIGQRTLIRMGSENATKIKARLREIRQELKLHMHE